MHLTKSIVYLLIFLVFFFFFKDNPFVISVIQDHPIKIIAAFLALNFMDFLNEKRPKGEILNYVDESLFTMKYGDLVMAISVFYVIIMAVYFAIAVKWYLIFIPIPILILSWITSPILRHFRGMGIFLLTYAIILIWAIIDFFM